MIPILICLIGTATAGISIATLFKVSMDEEKSRLTQMVRSQARLIEAIARFDVLHIAQDHSGDAFGATMEQIVKAHKSLDGFGETGEFVIGRLIEGQVAILQKPKHPGDVNFQIPEFIPIPMQKALRGESGEITATDYKGHQVLASYEPVSVLNIGLVAKIDTAEIHRPFIISGVIAAALSAFMLVIGIFAARFFAAPFEEKEAALKKLSKSQLELAKAQELAGLGSWTRNIADNLEEWSDEQFRIFGYEPGEVEPTLDLFVNALHPQDRQKVTAEVENTLKNNKSYDTEFRIIDTKGNVRQIRALGEVTRDGNGEPVSMIGTVMDITEAKNMQDQLIQSSKMATLGEMATGVAHELTQPLNVIRMAVSNIQRKSKNNKAEPKYLSGKLEKIDDQIERASAIIDHMRIFGRKSDASPVLLDPKKVVQSTLGLIGEQLRLANIEVVREALDHCHPILGHQVQIEQVLLNLIGNARDSLQSKKDGDKRISITVGENDASVFIAIEDTGSGIAEDDLSRVFEPFFTSKEIGKGTGLGLSISYGIINDMGGTITAANTDDGARFVVTLPQCKEEISRTS